MEAFDARKARALAELSSDEKDRSRKGGLDAPIASLVNDMNASGWSLYDLLLLGPHLLFAQRPPRRGPPRNARRYSTAD